MVVEPVAGLDGVDYLTYLGSYPLSPSRYFHDIITSIKASAKLTAIESIDAFTYDWRLPPWQYDWPAFKSTVERLRATSQRPVVLVVHSMGLTALNYALSAPQFNANWKKKNIRAIISINGAIGGSFKAIRAFISG